MSERETAARRELNNVVHRMLILGLSLSTVMLIIGLGLSAVGHRPIPSKVTELRLLYPELRTGSPSSLLSVGILLMIATPVLRVLGSLVEFVSKRDWLFAMITAAVLLILGASLFFGQG